MRNRSTKYLFGSNPKVLQSWSKYNLYHLRHLRTPPSEARTFFQQKWKAKSLARAYHGEQIREHAWERMFTRRLRGVVPMDAKYLGENDGSNESAGRGSGLESKPVIGSKPDFRRRRARPMPYMQMTFAPMERRLDVSIFRALFASSARQARQFVVHGAVKVNGKKMQFPGYLLNPGDMFQVDPEMVMFATGASKSGKQRKAGRQKRQKAKTLRDKEPQEGVEAETKPEAGETPTDKEHKGAKAAKQTSQEKDGNAENALEDSEKDSPDDATKSQQKTPKLSEKELQELEINPIDPTKPYATPWRPRSYMSAFAFIPRYLEVNQNVCAAVYLRHPVARPGFAEVPTPFPESLTTAAFAWYLRRR